MKCARVAASKNYKVFAVQNGGWCATGPNAHNTYKKYGPSNACRGDGEGGPWANAVYGVGGDDHLRYIVLNIFLPFSAIKIVS